MTNKTYKIVDGDISDGYHTFTELYAHRNALFCRLVRLGMLNNPFYVLDFSPGWDLVGGYIEALPDRKLEQVSYHLPVADRPHWLTKASKHFLKEFPKSKWVSQNIWDGHLPADVVERFNKSMYE